MVPEINYWAVLLATASSMVVGSIWYNAQGVRHAVVEACEGRYGSPRCQRDDRDHRHGAGQLRDGVGAGRVDRDRPGTSTAADTCGPRS
jgi:hypothetical protein